MRSYWLPERKAISSARRQEERPPAFHCRILRLWDRRGFLLGRGSKLWIDCELVRGGDETGRVKAERG